MKKNVLKTFLVVFACASLAACSGNTDKNQANKKECNNVEQLNQNKKDMKYSGWKRMGKKLLLKDLIC